MALAAKFGLFSRPYDQGMRDTCRFGAVAAFIWLAIQLSLHNAVHTPLFDSMRAGSYFLRTRKGPMASLVRDESLLRGNIYMGNRSLSNGVSD